MQTSDGALPGSSFGGFPGRSDEREEDNITPTTTTTMTTTMTTPTTTRKNINNDDDDDSGMPKSRESQGAPCCAPTPSNAGGCFGGESPTAVWCRCSGADGVVPRTVEFGPAQDHPRDKKQQQHDGVARLLNFGVGTGRLVVRPENKRTREAH